MGSLGWWARSPSVCKSHNTQSLAFLGATAIGPISYQPVDGRYPDYTRLLAGPTALGAGVEQGDMLTCIQPEYLKDADAAASLVTGRRSSISLALIGKAWVWSNPTLQIVVMPFQAHATAKFPASYSLEALSC